MELPNYHLPQWQNIFYHTLDRAKSFIKKAGTIIFVSCVLVWLLSNFNFRLQMVAEGDSILASFGRLVAPIFAPLGWGHWQGAVASLMGLVAKENTLSTFGVLFSGLGEVSENGREIWPQMQAAFTPVAAYSFLVFNLLCAPCFAAMGTIAREMNSRMWTFTAIGYQCALAYAVSLIFYQFGHVLFEGGTIGAGFVVAVILTGVIVYYIFRKPVKTTPTVHSKLSLEEN